MAGSRTSVARNIVAIVAVPEVVVNTIAADLNAVGVAKIWVDSVAGPTGLESAGGRASNGFKLIKAYPSPLTVLSSSQASGVTTIPSPQIGVHVVSWP